MNINSFTSNLFRSWLTIISPKLNAKICHFFKTGKIVNLKKPRTFSEKILYLKIYNYNKNDLVKKCADKYNLRNFVIEKKQGYLLNDIIAVYDKVDDIEWNRLPNQFALKWNFGCGFNIICNDKSNLDIKKTIKKLKKWEKVKYYLKYAELQYKNVNKKIIVEKFLSNNNRLPFDYKLYCFHGKCLAILYIEDRETEVHRAAFFDINWKYLGVPLNEKGKNKYEKLNEIPKKPKSLEKMIKAAEVLSNNFPFVRVDFYEINGKPILGEMTFTPAGGHDVSQIEINGKNMNEYL